MSKKTIRFLNSTGDKEITFDEASVENLAEAKAALKKAFAAGATALDVSAGAETAAKRVTKFEELGEETVVVPKIVGG